MLNFFRHFLQTKGPGHGLERFLEVVWRFTRGGRRLDHIIDLVEKTLGSHQVRITFFVSAGVIGRHRSRIERLKRLGHEIGSHGVYHSRMDLLDRSRQLHVLEESQILLERAGFDPQGFRSPYLSYDQGTREALESSRFLWTSGRVILWDWGSDNCLCVERLEPLYNLLSSEEEIALPDRRNEVLDIPVCAPDDEMLYERCRVRDTDGLLRAWTSVFDAVHQRGELCQILFHPERFPYTDAVIGSLVERVSNSRPPVWMATLREVGEWWRERGNWTWTRVQSGGLEVTAPEGSTFLVNAAGCEDSCQIPVRSTCPFLGSFRVAEPSARWPAWTITVSKRSPESLLDWLKEEGFCAEYGDAGEEANPFLDYPGFDDKDKRAILQKLDSVQAPLFRLWRWPNECLSAFCISGDICAVDLRDFIDRMLHF